MEIILREETKLVMGHRMYQSMSFLQMGAEELDECLNEACMENPMLDRVPPRERPELRMAYGGGIPGSKRQHGDYSDFTVPDRSGSTLRSTLLDQMLGLRLSPALEKAVRFIIINLDAKGYLPEGLRSSSAWRAEAELFEEALGIVRGMEPTGTGAENLGDCLCMQLERAGEGDSLACRICRECLEHLLKNHINYVSKHMGVSEAEVMEARRRISELSPIPSNGFDDGAVLVFAVPDVEITVENGELVVTSCDRYMPSYRINEVYSEMAGSSGLSEEDREYFHTRISEAKWIVSCVKRRQNTLLKCAALIAEEQRDFFTGDATAIRPCSMYDIAQRMGVHPSTVSRTVKDKYVACRWGVYPMSGFFAGDVAGETPDGILNLIKAIIEREDPAKPLSDSAISKKLADRGYDVARRTVAKYRGKAMIPPATGRKSR